MEKAAGAYLVEKQPEKALALYEQAISLNPALRDARMGRFYALQALREWRAAEKQLLDLETVTKPIIGSGRHKRFNPDLLDLYIERGWLLASEARLKEADAYFAELRDIAPANLDIRNAQAHVASWRGWKRKSLNSFRILESMEPDYLSARPGKIAVLDALSQKGTARRELSQMLTLHPRDKRFHNLNRIFQLGDMNVLSMEIRAQWEDDDTNDIFLQTTVSTPLSLDKNKLNYTQLHAFTLWRRTWNDDFKDAAGEDEAYFRRTGIGADHVFNSTFALRQQFSYDYYEGGDFGSYTRLRITPDDHWRVDALVDTFTIDVPARARIQDITAVKTSLGTVYRESEWRDYSLSLGRQWFSDDNNRDELLAGISQNLWVKDDWKMRLSGHAYFSMNSEYDDPTIIYFNPKNAWGLSVTHMTEQIVYHHYDRWFIHRLFLSAGNYKQYSYDNSFVGSIRYEQEYAFTDTHHLTWAGVFARNVYDGDTVSSAAFEFTYQWRF
jgi:biofilm PGA synthesis protein PgaA